MPGRFSPEQSRGGERVREKEIIVLPNYVTVERRDVRNKLFHMLTDKLQP